MYYPQMIAAGMVYKAVPPLYSIKQSKKTKYFTEQVDIVRYIQKSFLEKYEMRYANKSKDVVKNKDVTIFFMKNQDYIYYLDDVANMFAVNPILLEMILNNYVSNKHTIDINKLNKEVQSVYRFMKVVKEGNSFVAKGTTDKSILLPINDRFISECSTILKIIESNDYLYYLINGEKKSIYEIMTIYDKNSPSNIQRYKGLGEMDADELAESTLYPGSDRTLVRYTLEDAMEEVEAIREYESDTKKILSLVGHIDRFDLMD